MSDFTDAEGWVDIEAERAHLYARVAYLEAHTRLICLDARPKYMTTRHPLVKSGVAMSGAIMHYEVSPHLIHKARAALEGKG